MNETMNNIKCPCGELILKSYGNVTKLRSMLLVFNENNVMAKCRRCKSEHSIPIKIEMMKKGKADLHFVID
jgi:hypothetical protein